MKPSEKPIIFNTEMVRAILDGRKTETRRVIKPQPVEDPEEVIDSIYWRKEHIGKWVFPTKDGEYFNFPPYGKPGDLLYVRETFCRGCKEADPYCHCDTEELQKENHFYVYKADTPDAKYPLNWDDGLADDWNKDADFVPRWKPSIHMPKEAARIWLKVKDVQVERVQDITVDDIFSEGVNNGVYRTSEGHKKDFADLWNYINEKRGFGWDENPLVWVVEFEIASTTGRVK